MRRAEEKEKEGGEEFAMIAKRLKSNKSAHSTSYSQPL